ncbi:MAG: hypothetical protein JSS27_03185 [Planctomycetes bacterium]|nr:hypothetical protein [Planctomycetota bacterium]
MATQLNNSSPVRAGRALRAAVCLIAMALSALFAAQALAATPVIMHPTLMANVRMLDLHISGGKIVCGPLEPPRSMNSSHRNNTRGEKLTITCNGPSVTLHYELKLPEWELSYHLSGGREITLRRTPLAATDNTKVEFTQTAEGPLVLRVEKGDERRTLAASSLWLLMLDDPALCAAELAPYLEIIHPQWRIAQRAEALERALLRTSTQAPAYDTRQILGWVHQLGDGRFTARQAAQRQLTEAGPVVLPLLKQFDLGQLDAEQRYRLKQVMRGFVDEEDDSNDRLTLLMAGDAWTWFTLMRRDDAEVRRQAYDRLKMLVSAPVKFDAAAPAEERAAQLAQIEQAILQSIQQTRERLTAP